MSLRRTSLARKSELRRSTPIASPRSRGTIRTLRQDEPIPAGEPKRYTDGRGYIRLRWLVGTQTYVEEYEHRVVMGRPLNDVHHINGDKADNRPENLVVLSKREHSELHERQAKDANPIRGIKTRTLLAQSRTIAREQRVAAMRADYEAGMTTPQIAAKYGVHNSNVSRALRKTGTRMRPPAIDGGVLRRSQQVVKSRARMACEKCGRDTSWEGGQVHHRLPRGVGGSSDPAIHSPANLLLLCRPCHEWVESNRTAAYDAGWLVRRGSTAPGAVPVLLHLHDLPTYLTHDGRYSQEAPDADQD